MKKSGASQGQSASELISKRITELGDWRGETLSRMRKLIKEADPDVVEEWKWMGTSIWSHDGIICTGESYKNVVKLTVSIDRCISNAIRWGVSHREVPHHAIAGIGSSSGNPPPEGAGAEQAGSVAECSGTTDRLRREFGDALAAGVS